MLNFLVRIYSLLSGVDTLASATEGSDPTLDPIYNMLTILLPSAMGIVFAVGTIYGIVLGVQYAKAPSADERDKCKKRIYSMIIGVVVVIALLGILFAIRPTLVGILANNK